VGTLDIDGLELVVGSVDGLELGTVLGCTLRGMLGCPLGRDEIVALSINPDFDVGDGSWLGALLAVIKVLNRCSQVSVAEFQ
jgi:hypothetical protein